MYKKKLCLVLITLLVACNVDGRKSKKNKRKPEEENTTLQPNVVAYSTFGFNDVGSYNGFVPTSPDYASFLSGAGQEATTRLYAPAFPSAIETTGFGSNNYESPSPGGQSFGGSDENLGLSGMLQYTPHTANFFNSPNFGNNENLNTNNESEDPNEYTRDEISIPLYGTKINSRFKTKPENQHNNTDFNIFSNSFLNITNDKYLGFQESTHDNTPTFSDSSLNFRVTNSYAPSYTATGPEEYEKPITTNTPSALKFPKVVDFTKFNQFYPTDLEATHIAEDTKSKGTQTSDINDQNENRYPNSFNQNNNNHADHSPTYVNYFDVKNNNDDYEKNKIQKNTYSEGSTYNQIPDNSKRHTPTTKSKKKIKKRPWAPENSENDFKNWKDSSATKGYGYSTNVSNMNFKYGVAEIKKPFTNTDDEVIPASSNLVDLPTYQYPETDYSKFKKMPTFNDEDEFPPQFKSKDYLDHFKSLYSTTPATTSYWGNAFKSSDFSVFRDHPNQHQQDDINVDEVVNIPKRPNKSYFTPAGNKYNDWSSTHKNKPPRDWNKEILDTRYKSEEDLLGLRNHDTSHPGYLPTFKHSHNVGSANDYNKLVEKWRQSYVQEKLRDYESYASETKPMHVPIPKPYTIEVPHPVIVPVPRPFPVRVPVSKPVAVPVVQEISIPIEKLVPYPVFKKVPYPVIKAVPVPVEKEVAVPVEKPYPVHIPYIRPVFHHTRPAHDEYEAEPMSNDEDYQPRPQYRRKPPQQKRTNPSRHRSRRPSRMTYQERNIRRWPENRRPSQNTRPVGLRPTPYRYQEYEPEDDDRDDRNYVYCRRSGKC